MQYQHGGDIYSQNIEIDYSANLSPLGLPDGVRRRLMDCLSTTVCSVYPDSECRKLVKALGVSHGVPEAWILCGNGAADLIFGLVYARKPKRGLVTAPTFSEYEQALRVSGCRVDYQFLMEENGFRPDVERLLKRILLAGAEGTPYDMVFLCNPNNPTGIPVKAEDVRRLAEACERTGTLLIVDECFCEFLEQPQAYSIIGELGRFQNLFVLKAFTKLYSMAGLRLGYGLCGNAEVLESLRAARQPWSVSGLAQEAGEAALKELAYVERVREIIKTERHFLWEELQSLGFTVYDSQANYLFFKEPALQSGASGWLYRRLLARRVLIRNCGNYPGLDVSFSRICVKTRAENECLMEHIKAAVREQYSCRRTAQP